MKIEEYNTETHEVTVRDATPQEIAAAKADAAEAAKEKANREALEAKKQEVLAKLGLTADEVAALLA